MPDLTIAKIKIRRGTNTQLNLITLEQGELGYTTDTKRLWAGDGLTVGGISTANKFWYSPNVLLQPQAIQNDLVWTSNKLWALSGTDNTDISNYGYVGPQFDNWSIKFEPTTNAVYWDQASLLTYSYGAINNNTQGLSANTDNTTIGVNLLLNALEVVDNGISESKLANTSVSQRTLSANVAGALGGLVVSNGLRLYTDSTIQITAAGRASVDYTTVQGMTSIAGANQVFVDNSTVVFDTQNRLKVGTLTYANMTGQSITYTPPFAYYTLQNGIITGQSSYLSAYTTNTPTSAYVKPGGSTAIAPVSSVAVDFSAFVPGLVGYIRVYANP